MNKIQLEAACDFQVTINYTWIVTFQVVFVVAILNLVELILLWQINWNFAYEFFASHSEL